MTDKTLENLDVATLERDLRQHVHCLCEEIGARSIFNYDNLCRAERYITEFMKEAGFLVERHSYHWYGLELTNLIAHESRYSEQGLQYVLCAHYDTVTGTPGADDNASAVAVLLETARLGRAHNLATNEKGRWRFIAFTAEEPPAFHTRHQGSRVFARQAKRKGMRIDGVVNLEMVGYFLNSPKSQRIPFPLNFLGYSRTGNFVAVVGNWRSRQLTRQLVKAMHRNAALPVESAIVPERGFSLFAVRLSDHSSFWDHGYPAVMVTDTAFFRNPYYHTYADTAEKLNFSAMAEVVRSLLFFVAETTQRG